MIRTGYSFRRAIGHVDDVIARLQYIGWSHAPICDYLSTFGFNRFTKAAKKAGLKPVYGVELACTPKFTEKAPVTDRWRFLAKSSLRPLHEVIYKATQASSNEPCIIYGYALKQEGLIKITGNRPMLEGLEPQPDFYIGLSPSLPAGLYRQAERKGFNFIAVSDNVYPRAEDRELYRVALGWRSETQTYPQHILDDDEWRTAVGWYADQSVMEQALANRARVLDECNATLKHATLLKPQVDCTLRELCEQGAIRTGTDLSSPLYRERLDRELKLIEEKKFADYFFILADMIGFAKQHMIVGPARGSSCGSLVCYLLNITTVDPIPFGLIFERFIDINRTDLPDIDVDFSDEKRWMVFDYAEKKYGKAHVARLGTVGLFRPRSALNQAGITLRIPKWEVTKVLDTLVERSSGDSRALQTLIDTLNDTDTGRDFIARYPEAMIVAPLEGHPNIASQHAAGIVITQEPIIEYVAVDARTKSVMCDKKDSEDLNLLKIDALGLTQLSIFERCLELIGEEPRSGWLEKLPLDDPKAFAVFNKGHFSGIFQFNGSTLQAVTERISGSHAPVSHINDIIQITALARPGPAASGGLLSWTQRRIGEEEITTAHPMLTELTRDTYGVIIYQEQVMKVVREMGNMSWEDTSAIRKAMSGRLGDEFFAGYWQKFKTGAAQNGIEEALALNIWRQINTMGSWAFNQSHAVAYGLVSYYCAYLKAHHPIEFAAATLDAEKESAKQISLLRELAGEGVSYQPYDLEHSTDRWTVHGNKLIGPLTVVKGIGPATVQEIMSARKNGQPIRDTLAKKLNGATTEIDSLFPIRDAINELIPDLFAAGIETVPTPLKHIQNGVTKGDVVVIGVAERLAPFDENEPIRIERRKGKRFYGDTQALNIFLRDDTEQLLCRIDRFMFPVIGKDIIERGRPGKAIYAFKGYVPDIYRMLIIKRVKFLGFTDQLHLTQRNARRPSGYPEKLPAGEQQSA